MILHIADDEKVIYYAVEQFERIYPGRNLFLINTKSRQELKHITSNDRLVVACDHRSNKYRKIFKEIGSVYDTVFFHSLIKRYAVKKLCSIAPEVKVFWTPFGAEVYEKLSPIRDQIYMPATKRALDGKNTGGRAYRKRLFGGQLYDLRERELRRAIDRVDYVASTMREGYDQIRTLTTTNAGWCSYSYYGLEQIFPEGLPEGLPNGDNIMIGNSKNPANNHIEIFEQLKAFDLKGREVLVPYSYGRSDIDHEVLEIGATILKESFRPLTKFLPIREYNEIVKSCAIVIMNHIRQQAMGNVIAALYQGAKVFLNPESIVYKYFIRIGVNVYSVADLTPNACGLFAPLGSEKVEANREILKTSFSTEKIYASIRAMQL